MFHPLRAWPWLATLVGSLVLSGCLGGCTPTTSLTGTAPGLWAATGGRTSETPPDGLRLDDADWNDEFDGWSLSGVTWYAVGERGVDRFLEVSLWSPYPQDVARTGHPELAPEDRSPEQIWMMVDTRGDTTRDEVKQMLGKMLDFMDATVPNRENFLNGITREYIIMESHRTHVGDKAGQWHRYVGRVAGEYDLSGLQERLVGNESVRETNDAAGVLRLRQGDVEWTLALPTRTAEVSGGRLVVDIADQVEAHPPKKDAADPEDAKAWADAAIQRVKSGATAEWVVHQEPCPSYLDSLEAPAA